MPKYSQGLLGCGLSVSLDFYAVTPIAKKAKKQKKTNVDIGIKTRQNTQIDSDLLLIVDTAEVVIRVG